VNSDLVVNESTKGPDSRSRTLRTYHRILWSKELPNGEFLNLDDSCGSNKYLVWKSHDFGSDSITATFRYPKMENIVRSYFSRFLHPREAIERDVRKLYTIGSSIIFPKHTQSMNQRRGTNPLIGDRWDRTLECIRGHYVGEKSPLSEICEIDSWFYDLFVDFKGYVDFFFLQDCVSKDYSKAYSWLNDEMDDSTFPTDVDSYSLWLNNNLEFTRKRNQRIADHLKHL